MGIIIHELNSPLINLETLKKRLYTVQLFCLVHFYFLDIICLTIAKANFIYNNFNTIHEFVYLHPGSVGHKTFLKKKRVRVKGLKTISRTYFTKT